MIKAMGIAINELDFRSELRFWALSFIYASFMALLLQKAILPLWPEMHAGHGLLKNDAIVFHNMAVEIAQRIHAVGWSVWQIYPSGASANVGLLSLLYALFSPDPAWFIPFNAAAHATGALLIYRIGARLVDGDVGKLGGLLAAGCFLVFPSALQWYGQNHKDAFAILGLLLILDAWVATHDDKCSFGFQKVVNIFYKVLLGVVLLGLVRPYFIVVVLLGLLASFLVASVWHSKLKVVVIRLGFVTVVALLAAFFARVGTAEDVHSGSHLGLNVGAYTPELEKFLWKENTDIPLFLDKGLRRASEIRAHFVYYGRSVGAGSDVDVDRLPNTAWAAINYMPRSLFVGLFAPFPMTWGERVSLPRLIGAMETTCWYFACLGVVISIARHRSRKMLAGVVFCAVLLALLAYVHPNVGTLYRQRFGIWHFFMLIGCIGWVSLLFERLSLVYDFAAWNVLGNLTEKRSITRTSPSQFSGQSLAVILISLGCYLGFFARDLLLTGQLGLGERLDAFFAAAMIPMFFVNFLAMPISDAFVLPFITANNSTSKEQERLLRDTLSFALIILVSVMIFVVVAAPWLVTLVLRSTNVETTSLAVDLVRWFAPIIFLSALTTVGNAALNALRYARATALGQLVVPAVTLASVVLSPSEKIMVAVVGGVLLGTLINAMFVYWRLHVIGFLLLPGRSPLASTQEFRRIYFPLVASAVLPASLIPMNYAFAAWVNTGMVAAWALSSKVVVLFAGLMSASATAVLLPRMAALISLGEAKYLRRDTNLQFALGIWLGGAFMLGGVHFAEPVVATLLGNGLAVDEVIDLALIVKIGLLQIPVAIVGVLANKLVVAGGGGHFACHVFGSDWIH